MLGRYMGVMTAVTTASRSDAVTQYKITDPATLLLKTTVKVTVIQTS